MGPPQGVLEGAFWSLYVEVKFYLVTGVFYFLFGEKKTIWVLVFVFLSSAALPFLAASFPNLDLSIPRQIEFVLSAKYFGWFASGALLYVYTKEHHTRLLVWAVVIGLAAAFSMKGVETQAIWAGIVVVLLFASSILSKRLQSFLTHPYLLVLGFVSYPLYLLHENMMVSLIVKMGAIAPWMPALLVPIIPMLLVIALGWMVAKFAEPWVRNQIIGSYKFVARKFRPQ